MILKKQWKEVVDTTSEVDLTFLVLRIVSLLGGLLWLFLVPLPARESSILVRALSLFALYSLGCYVLIFLRPAWIRKVYLASLFLDMVFLSHLIRSEANFENSFFLGFYLLVSLHTLYFGLRFGLMVATLSALAYYLSIFPLLQDIEWTDLGLRMAFLYFIAVPVGLLSERIKREKENVEDLNRQLADSLENLKRIQKKLIEAEKFSAIGRLTADIAHEIRNPLTAVGGFARRLDKRLVQGSKEKEYMTIIINEVDRLEKILVDTLVYGKASDFTLVRSDLTEPVAAVANLYRELCRERDIQLVEKYAADLPKTYIEQDQVRQALDCLVSNSLDAMSSGGTLTIEIKRTVENMTPYLIVVVKDTGGGIPREIVEFIFEPFYSTKKIGMGTGLGLPIVRKIMEEHRGMVRLENVPGEGASFALYFPNQSEEEEQKLSCWEFMRCGIEKDPSRRCPAYPYFGRICWSIAGTEQEGHARGICAAKIESCRQCTFFQMIHNCLPLYRG